MFHCFTESQAVAKAALDLGFLISFSGILTFKERRRPSAEVAAFVPLDRCLIQKPTALSWPRPYRSKTNSPAYVPYVAKRLAEIKGFPKEIGLAASRNFEQLFSSSSRCLIG